MASKFLLKLAQEPTAQELLKKHLGPEEKYQDPVFKELVSRDIIPIIGFKDGKETAFLGEGMYSRTFEVSYKGKLAVAKVSRFRGEGERMIKLNQLRDKLGADARHVTQVYDDFMVKTEGGTEYVTVVEKLIPINPHIMHIILPLLDTYFEDDTISPTFIRLKHEADIPKIMEDLNTHVKNMSKYRFRLEMSKLEPDIKSKFMKSFENLSGVISLALNKCKNAYEFNLTLEKYFDTIFPGHKDDRTLISYLLSEVISFIDRALGFSQSFPTSTTHNDFTVNHFLSKPETKDFMSFLLRLNKEFGVDWDDLHESNIMMRPDTHDLVVSDPGYFSL